MRTTLLAALALVALASAAAAADANAAPLRTLTVDGEGIAAAAPDLAVVRLGATAQHADAASAQRRVGEIVSAAIAAISATGVAERDIQTEQLNLNPVYADRRGSSSSEPDPGPRIVGYRATNTVAVRVRDLSRVGAVLDAGVSSGANELRGVDFRLEDDGDEQLAALRAATEEARRKARAIADAAGVRLGALQTIREGGTPVVSPHPEARLMMAADAAGTPIASGQVQVRATVTLVYAIGD